MSPVRIEADGFRQEVASDERNLSNLTAPDFVEKAERGEKTDAQALHDAGSHHRHGVGDD